MRRTVSVVVSCFLLIAVAGCASGGSDADPPTTTRPKRATTTSPPTTGTTQLPPETDQAAGVEFRPVLAVVACAGPSDGPAAEPGTTIPERDGLRAPAGQAAGDPTTTIVGTTDPDTPVSNTTTPDGPDGPSDTTVPAGNDYIAAASTDGAACYQLGPVAGDGHDLTDVTADQVEGSWIVTVNVRPDARARLNELFDACQRADDACPSTGTGNGSVAIVVDGTVVSAPAVNGTGLADQQIQISGTFTEAEADALVDRLTP